ncbi:hypothetical protein, partial [Acinetobacter baumannii]|uniref:hypothetical protein n=1 Tax=Acinetobacter baumannii TaxID=470 RepID=UPI00165FDE9A
LSQSMGRHVRAHVLHGHEPLHPLHDHAHEHHNVNVVYLLNERRVDNTFAQGDSVNVGLSWIYDRGYTGISYSNRRDQYGLPG